MPRFYFHFHDEDGHVADPEGRELANDASARIVAVREARELAGEDVKQGRLNLRNFIRVTGAQGRHLFDVRFGEVVRVVG